jgi:VanZ family protein
MSSVRTRHRDAPGSGSARHWRTGLARHWGPVAAYMGIIFYLSSRSQVPLGVDASDKLLHTLAYFGLAIVVVRALCRGLPARVGRTTAIVGWLVVAAYGVTDEVHQMFVPGRTPAVDDLVADAVGGFAGVVLCWAWGKMSA